MIQDREIEKALEELKRPENTEVFRAVGPVLVKGDKQSIIKDLEETREEIELKLKTIEKQEKKLRDKLKENQEKFQTLIPKAKGHGG